MAHKKIHPAEGRGPMKTRDRSMSSPSPSQRMPMTAGDQEHDAKRRMGAFAGKGAHARQQQMGNKD
jgi:hypothetical protein